MSNDIELTESQKSDLITIKKLIIDKAKDDLERLVTLFVLICKTLGSPNWAKFSVREFTAKLATIAIGDEEHDAGLETIKKSTVHDYIRVCNFLNDAKMNTEKKVRELLKAGFSKTKLLKIVKGNATLDAFKVMANQALTEKDKTKRKAIIDDFINLNQKDSAPTNPSNEDETSEDVGKVEETSQTDSDALIVSTEKMLTRIFDDISKGDTPQEIENGSNVLKSAFNRAVESIASDVDNFLVVLTK